jgi:hypothetical protein
VKRIRNLTQYVAALVRKGERDPQRLFEQVWAAIIAGEVRRPHTATILWYCFREGVSRALFPTGLVHTEPYQKVIDTLGPQWLITPTQVAERTGLPLRSVRPT